MQPASPIPSLSSRLAAWAGRRWPALLAWVVLPALILALPRGFHGNDDTLIVECLRSGHPAPFLGDRMAPALAFLYAKAGQDVPWYGLLLYLTLCAAGHAGWRMLRILGEGPAPARKAWTCAASVLLLAVLWSFSLHLTFTIVAITACGMALLAFLVEAVRGNATWRSGAAYGALAVVGAQWRPDGWKAAVAGLGLIGAALLCAALWRRRKALAWPLLAFVLPAAALAVADRVSPPVLAADEQVYREYNAARGAIQGFDKYREIDVCNPEGLRQAGWNAWNYSKFTEMFNFDEDRFPVDRVRALAPLALPVQTDAKAFGDHFLEMTAYAWPLLPLAFLCAFLTGGPAGGRRRMLLGAGAAALHMAYMVGLIFFLAVVMRSPPRVTMPVLLVASLASLAAVWWIQGEHWLGFSFCPPATTPPGQVQGARLRLKLRAGFLAICAAALAAVMVSGWLEMEAEFENLVWKKHGTLAQAIRTHAPQAADKVIVEYACLTGFASGVDPLVADPMPFRTVFTEWVPPSPFFYECLRKAGIPRGADLIRTAHARPGGVFFLIEEPYLPQFEEYAQGDLGRVVHCELAYDIHWPKLALYRLVDGPSPRLSMPGCVPGTRFHPGEKLAPIPKAAAPPG